MFVGHSHSAAGARGHVRSRVMSLAASAAAATTAAVALVTVSAPLGEARAASTLVARYDMSEPSGSQVLSDSGGNGLDGSIGNEVVTGGTEGGVTFHRFPWLRPGDPTLHPGHLDVVPDAKALDFGAQQDFAVVVRYRSTFSFGNIVQKGQNATPGGYFKIENDSGVATCVIKNAAGLQLAVSSRRRINDGQWHTVECRRTAGEIAMFVDGTRTATNDAVPGQVSNDKALTIGGKADCAQDDVECDYFPGDVDWVEIRRGPFEPGPPAPPAGPAMYHPVTPSRLFDTRPGQSPGALRAVPFARVTPAAPLQVKVTDVTGLVPAAGVAAVSLNLAATGASAGGFLTAYPCGTRNLVANVNWTSAGATVSNAVVAPVAADGTICIYASTPTDVVADINGWFATGADYAPVTPTRLFDTRAGESTGALRPVAVGQVTPAAPLQVKVTELSGLVPAGGVGAVSLNLAATGTSAGGFLTAYPCGTRNLVANVNWTSPGATVSNAVIAPVAADGTICIYASTPTDVVADINGWFIAP